MASVTRVVTSVVAEVCDRISGPAIAFPDFNKRIRQLLESVNQAMGSSPDPAALASLDRAIQAGARRLSALGTRLAATLRSSNADPSSGFIAQFLAACMVCSTLTVISKKFELDRAASALCCCATLPLECGPQAPPEALLAWLSAAVSTLSMLQASSDHTGATRDAQSMVASIVFYITSTGTTFSHFAAALQLDSALQHKLVTQLAVPMLHAAAATARLPADQWPALADFVFNILHVTSALTSHGLCLTFEQLLAQPAGSDSISTSLQHVLQSAAVLFTAAPASRLTSLDPVVLCSAWFAMIILLGTASAAVASWQQQHGGAALPAVQRQQVLQALLLAMPQLPTALHVLAEHTPQAVTQHGPLPVLLMNDSALSSCREVAGLVWQLAWEDAGKRFAPNDLLRAVEALWLLHTTLCRCIHSIAAGSLAMPDISVDVLLDGMLSSMAVAAFIAGHATVEAGTASIEGQPRAMPRRSLAMSVAHAEAVLAAAAFQPAPSDIKVATGLLSATRHGPSALVFCPPVRQALEGLADRLETQGSEAAALHTAVAALLHCEPQPGNALELAQAAAARSCAYLRCANLAGEGGPAAGQGTGSQRCSKCRVAWYCGTACSHADWRAGHRRVCRALGAARAAEQEIAYSCKRKFDVDKYVSRIAGLVRDVQAAAPASAAAGAGKKK
ncbi:hypothetical protein D9Q98_003683 [Chlorella vulgaris]|uniref:MYND-type domain-containing protein n=1 Tax=Chlorella vulgaris TaxID=3077 RepID=A0A9D4TT45_CHLVU|nr:hypothetical protein D9Q98_003683 [Chlorella vulgaris]